jgi:vancomycin permeability regulator SanA
VTAWTPPPRKPKQRPRTKFAATMMAERRMAAKSQGYTWPEFLDLPGDPWAMELCGVDDCKANVVAMYRIETAVEAIMSES